MSDAQRGIDSSVLRKFAAGDPEAVRQLYQAYGRAVFTAAYSALRDRGLAEEAVQLTFLQAWRAADRFDIERTKPTSRCCPPRSRRPGRRGRYGWRSRRCRRCSEM